MAVEVSAIKVVLNPVFVEIVQMGLFLVGLPNWFPRLANRSLNRR